MTIQNRIMQIDIEIGSKAITYRTLAMTASGDRYSNTIPGNSTITIANMTREDINSVITELTPFRGQGFRTDRRIAVFAGREGTSLPFGRQYRNGLTQVFTGFLFRANCQGDTDRLLTIQAISSQQDRVIGLSNSVPSILLSRAAERIATRENLSLEFRARDKTIKNYSYTGSSANEIEYLSRLAEVSIYRSNDSLVVDEKTFNRMADTRNIVSITGRDIVDIPQITETGCRITTFFDIPVNIGDILRVKSNFGLADGDWIVYKQSYNLSNRDVPWYLTSECRFTR